MPFRTEHACRLKSPDLFDRLGIVRVTRHHKGKIYSIIRGNIDGVRTDQAYRYKKDIWSKKEALKHCKDHDGILFEVAKE